MKKSSSGNYTIYESTDPCELHKYSETLAKELEKKDNEIEKSLKESADNINELEEENILNEENITEIIDLLPKVSDEGESITLENTARAKFTKFRTKGNSSQETRSGKNKFNGRLSQGYDSNGAIRSSNQFVCNTDLIDVKPTTQYVVSNNLNLSITSISYYKDGTFVRFQANINSFTITIPEDVNQVRINFYKEPSLSVSDFTYVQLEKGSKATEYEQYGTMPSEEFPSEIRNVGDNINIFNKNSTFISYQTKIEVLDKGIKVINLSTVKYASAYTRLGGKELLGKTITLYSDIEESEGASANVLLYFGTESKPSSGGIIQKINNGSKNAGLWNIPSEFPDGYDRIHLYFYGSNATESAANSYVNYNNIKAEIGDTPSPYSEYNCGNIDIGLYNENIFNLEELMKISSEYSEVNDGYAFTANIKMYKTGIPLATPISLPASISYDIKNGTGTNFRFKFWFDDGTSMTLSNYVSGTDDKLHNITINNFTRNGATKIIKIGIDFSTAGTFTITNFMINEGTTVKPYIKHQESHKVLELNKPLYQNCYLAEDGIHYTKTQIQLDGVTYGLRVESVTLSNTSNLYYCVIEIPKHPGVNGINNMYCSHFLPYFGLKVGSCYITNYGKYIVIVLTDQTITTVDAANAWLAAQKEKGTPVVIEYELAEEEVEEYTEAQKEARKQIKNARSYEGQTNIFSTNEIKPIFEVEALADIGLLLNNMQAQILAGGE